MISTLYSLIIYLFSIILVCFGFLVGYLVFLTIASFWAARRTKLQSSQPRTKFAILIPAHNEERLLPNLLNSLSHLDYPAHLFKTYVVADNCTDQTASIAQSNGVNVYIRTDLNNRGKGPALQWLLGRVFQADTKIDAFLILDADSIVNPNFLRVMAAHLDRGERVIQAYYSVHDPGHSWSSSLRFTAFAALHYLRPSARMVLGGSAGLKGNGMVFSAEIFNRYRWSASVTEDIELHMQLILDGECVTFAPDAVVSGEMPDTLSHSASQHDRWERGRLEMRRRYVPKLAQRCLVEIGEGHFKQAYLFFDAIMEHLIPPFSVLIGANLFLILLNLFLVIMGGMQEIQPLFPAVLRFAQFNLFLSLVLMLGQAFYVITSLKSIHASKDIYLRLLFAPAYMTWKFLQYGRVMFKHSELEWVRTRRNGG